MRRSLNDIIEEINDAIGFYFDEQEVFYNLSVLQTDSYGNTFPMTRKTDDEGIQISPLDTKGINFYHRLLGPVEVEPLQGSKGNKSYSLVTYPLRLVGVGYRKNIITGTYWNNQEVADQVMVDLGSSAFLSGKEILQVNGRVITDKLEVLTTEFAGQQEFINRTLDLIAFSIDYQVKQRQVCFKQPTYIIANDQFLVDQNQNYIVK